MASNLMEQAEEQQWIANAQAGSEADFGRLITAYQKKVYGFVLGYVRNPTIADELTQTSFLKAWKALPRFRGDCAFQTWLFQIALNVVRSWGRWQKLRFFRERPLESRTERDDEDSPSLADRQPDRRSDANPEIGLETEDLKKQLQDAVDKLPPKEKMVFMLRHDQDLPLKDIGVAMGIAEGSVKAHLFHALEKLRKVLKEN